MRLRTLLAVTLTMFALPVLAAEMPVAPMPRPATKSSVYQLRNVAAADVQHAIETYLRQQRFDPKQCVVIAEPVSNSVLVSAEAELQRRLLDLIAALDKAPAQVTVTATVIQVPRGFVAESGLNVGGKAGETAWTLSAREAHMFTGLLRAAKSRGELEVLSRPQVCVCDGQTGYVQIGQQFPVQKDRQVRTSNGKLVTVSMIEYVPTGLSLRLTPRVSPDGNSLRLATEFQMTAVKGTATTGVAVEVPGSLIPSARLVTVPAFNTQTLRTTSDLQFGQTLVLASTGGEAGNRSWIGAMQQHCSGDKYEILVILTPELVQPQVVKPAGWFLK